MFTRVRRLLATVRRRVAEDVAAIRDRDPAAGNLLVLLTCYPGLHALWVHRIAHRFWTRDHPVVARLLAQGARLFTGVDIHPAAEIGRRCVIDHGQGVVIGSTAELGDDVLVYHGVTLGNRVPRDGKRHPTVGDDVLLGANATVLGPIDIGDGARIGAGAVVVDPVASDETVVGNPARPVDATDQSARIDGVVCDGGQHRCATDADCTDGPATADSADTG